MKINLDSTEKKLLIFFYIFSFVYVFSIAFMNGDDVVHFAQNFRKVFLPHMKESWTPNRVFDMYGRTIFSQIFSYSYHAINSIYQINFHTLYKIFSAAFFSIFLTFIFWFSIKAFDIREKNIFKYLFIIIFSILIVQIFFWRNQVHFICYQLPAWLTFILLKLTYDSKNNLVNQTQFTRLVLLSYICAFSLESYALIVFITSSLLFLQEFKNQGGTLIGQIKKSSYLQILLVNILFSFTAITIALVFSQRIISPSINYSNLMGIINNNVFYFFIFFVILIFLKKMKNINTYTSFLLSLISINIFVVFVISIKINTDYFDLISYPWGDLMLIGKISLFFLLISVINFYNIYIKKYQAIFSFLLFILLSNQVFILLYRIDNASQLSLKVDKIYKIIALEKNVNFDTGLNLDNIAMPIRPFPSPNSPEWFKQSYQSVFKKYYSVQGSPAFN